MFDIKRMLNLHGGDHDVLLGGLLLDGTCDGDDMLYHKPTVVVD